LEKKEKNVVKGNSKYFKRVLRYLIRDKLDYNDIQIAFVLHST